ncbi:MAG: DHA2 family efflux MFS transporter permease subunit [Candidatus Gastranaerophilales bacterium]|nr:DHA2 family efflux MFS transporter permease subunit [Candidatus Gastranaerophilales bacterium]
MENSVPTKTINPWLMIIPPILASFMCILDTTIGNVALPHMAGALSATRDESMWILTSYLVASGVIMPAVDWLSKIFGRKLYYIISISVFVLASILCGMAKSLGFMVFARVLQGLGGGGIVPIANAIIFEGFAPKERGRALSIFGIGVVLAPIIGPVIGGWITDNWTWPWIFFINIPFGILSVFLAFNLIEDPPFLKRTDKIAIDFKGFCFLIIWLACFQTVLDKGNNAGWFDSAWICWTFAISVISCILFFYFQFTTKDSLLDLSVFKDRNYTIGIIIQVIGQAVLYSSLAILPQFLQNMLGYSAYLSGVTIMTRGMGSVIALIITGTCSNLIDNRIFTGLGLLMMGVSGILFGNLNMQISPDSILLPNVILGVGVGFTLIPIMSVTIMTLQKTQMTNASAIQNLLKNVAGAVGTSLVSTLVTRYSQVHQYMLVANLTPLNPNYTTRLNHLMTTFSGYSHDVAQKMAEGYLYKELVTQSTLFGYIDAFRVFGIVCFFIIPLLLLFRKQSKT